MYPKSYPNKYVKYICGPLPKKYYGKRGKHIYFEGEKYKDPSTYLSPAYVCRGKGSFMRLRTGVENSSKYKGFNSVEFETVFGKINKSGNFEEFTYWEMIAISRYNDEKILEICPPPQKITIPIYIRCSERDKSNNVMEVEFTLDNGSGLVPKEKN